MTITFKGSPVTLKDQSLNPGDKMPDFTLTDVNMNTVNGSNMTGIRVFVVVPSLDTGVCDLEVRNFNKKATTLPGVKIYAVSLDLPFAQSRWCGTAGIRNVETLSDYKDRSFGKATGTLILELALLTRAVFIVDAANTVLYAEYVPEVTEHPDYERIYGQLKEMAEGDENKL